MVDSNDAVHREYMGKKGPFSCCCLGMTERGIKKCLEAMQNGDAQ